jgi:hypothetical protein
VNKVGFLGYGVKLAVLLLLACNNLPAQEPATIRVRKQSKLAKAVFDNTKPALVVIDRFGNPVDNAILSYTLYIKYRNDTEAFEGHANQLSPDMVAFLRKTKKSSKLFFTGIKARDDNGHIVPLPDVIEVWFPDCKGCR